MRDLDFMPASRQQFPGMDKIVIVFMIDRLSLRSGVAGGSERQIVELVNSLDQRCFRPIFICGQQRVPTPLWGKIKCEKHLTNLYSLQSWNAVKTLLWLVRLFRKEAVDLVVTFFPDSTLLGVLAARAAGVSSVISTRRDMGYWYDSRILIMLRFLNLLTTRVLANACAVKKHLVTIENIEPSKVDVIHNGINLAEFDNVAAINLYRKYSNIKSGDEVVGIVANFDRKVKRLDLFIKAAAEILIKRPNVKFIIVGGGANEAGLRQIADRRGVSNNVIFAGHLEDTAAYVKAFSVGVSCSDSEGLSNTIIEYMAASLPCVATAVGGNVELVSHMKTGLLVEKNNASALAAAILYLLVNRPLADRLGENARKTIERKYGWNNRVNDFENYFRKIVEKEKGARS